MSALEIIQVVELVWSILGPIASKMVENAMNGTDPLDALERETVEQILPAQSRLDLAMLTEKARRALAAK